MSQTDTKRLSRLIALLTQLQTKRLLTATWLAEKFDVSKRTIYRDIKALEQAGVPILTDEGRGYSLMEGYKIPPIMFSETEANALITGPATGDPKQRRLLCKRVYPGHRQDNGCFA